jgi:hypothetical protein
MRKHYDFSQAVRNPYAKRLKKQRANKALQRTAASGSRR